MVPWWHTIFILYHYLFAHSPQTHFGCLAKAFQPAGTLLVSNRRARCSCAPPITPWMRFCAWPVSWELLLWTWPLRICPSPLAKVNTRFPLVPVSRRRSDIWFSYQLILIWLPSPFPQINFSAAKKRHQNLSTPNLSFKCPWFKISYTTIQLHDSAQVPNGSHQKPEKLWLQINIIFPLVRLPLQKNWKYLLFPNPNTVACHYYLQPKLLQAVCFLPKLIFPFMRPAHCMPEKCVKTAETSLAQW